MSETVVNDVSNSVRPGRVHLAILAAGMIVFGCASVLLGKDVMWDLRNYHYYNAYAFFHDRIDVDYAPAQLQSYHNPILDIPFYVFVQTVPPAAVGFLMGALHGINFWLIFLIAKTLLESSGGLSRRAVQVLALLCATLGMYSPNGISTLGTATNDLFASQFILGSLYLLLLHLRGSRRSSVRLVASGVLMGLACGTKLTSAIFTVPLASGLLMGRIRWRRKLGEAAVLASAMVVGLLAGGGYWMSVLFRRFGNPIFPYYNAVFRSESWEPVNFIDRRFFPDDVWQLLFYPFYFLRIQNLVMEAKFRDARYAVVYVMIVIVVGRLCWRSWSASSDARNRLGRLIEALEEHRSVHFLLLFVGLSYIGWLVQFSYFRYLTPLELVVPSAILLACLLVFRSRRVGLVVCGGLFVVIAILMRVPDLGRAAWGDEYFGVEVPAVRKDVEILALMTGTEPYAYFIPFFPQNVRFLRLEGNHMKPNRGIRMRREILELIAGHDGPIYLFAPSPKIAQKGDLLRTLHLQPASDRVFKVRSAIGPPAGWVELSVY